MMRGLMVNMLTGEVVACVFGDDDGALEDAFLAVEENVGLLLGWADYTKPGITHVKVDPEYAVYEVGSDIDEIDAAYIALSIDAERRKR